MNTIFLSWATGLFLTSIGLFSPIVLTNNSIVNAKVEEKINFTETTPQVETIALSYQFLGQNDNDLRDPNMWQPVGQPGAPTCDNIPVLPCTVEFESTDFEDIEAFYNNFTDLDDLMTNGTQYIKSTKSS